MVDANPTGTAPAASRRDFIHIMAVAMAVGGAAGVAWPLISQMEPAADALAQGSPITVDVSKIAPGQQIVLLWRKTPIFIVNRTPPMLAALQAPQNLALLRDPDSQHRQQPDYARNWSRSIRPEFLVLVGVCTHLGCVPGFMPKPGSIATTAWPGGWFCPCHGSKYDLAGRVFRSVPAPLNLPVPPHHYASDTQIVVGANPPGASFELSQVETI
jgi:ubiquinol-cytochrome c reductase iron-sulfur subunit